MLVLFDIDDTLLDDTTATRLGAPDGCVEMVYTGE
jgi:hypothetical protein